MEVLIQWKKQVGVDKNVPEKVNLLLGGIFCTVYGPGNVDLFTWGAFSALFMVLKRLIFLHRGIFCTVYGPGKVDMFNAWGFLMQYGLEMFKNSNFFNAQGFLMLCGLENV